MHSYAPGRPWTASAELLDGVPLAGAIDFPLDLRLEGGRRDDARERAEPEDPAPERPVVADVERQQDAAVLTIGVGLRRMPAALADVRSDAGLEQDLDVLRTPLVDAE